MSGAKPPGSAHPKVEPDGTPWNIGCAPGQPDIVPTGPSDVMHAFNRDGPPSGRALPSFVLDLDRASSGHASVLDAYVGTFVTS